MNQKYLCATHRQQLRNYPKQAVRAWSKSYENGQSLISMGFSFEALAHLGCAFEAAEIVLSTNVIETIDAVAMLTSSAATLAKLLSELGQPFESQNVVELTNNRIMQEIAKYPEMKALLQNQITSLRYFVQESEEEEYPLEDEHLSIFNLASMPTPAVLH